MAEFVGVKLTQGSYLLYELQKGSQCLLEYPKLPSRKPNRTHQADLKRTCFLRGPIRFYSQNAIDVATGSGGVEPSPGKNS